MKTLVRQAMEAGALGVGSSLIYAPAFYAKTDELIALCKVAALNRGRRGGDEGTIFGHSLVSLGDLFKNSAEVDLPEA